MNDLKTMADRELIEAYADRESEPAIAELISRYNSLVYRTCFRLLRNTHDAEEAAQATFVVLARKAGSLRAEGKLNGWLHRVARNVGLHALRNRAAREKQEGLDTDWQAQTGVTDPQRDVESVLSAIDGELDSLSAVLREAVILRYLRGLSEKEAAALAGCAVGAMKWRASDGVSRLRTRLAKRGIVFGSAALIGLLEAEAQSAVPATLLQSTVTVVKSAAAAGSTASLGVVELSKGVIQMMFWNQVRVAALIVTGLFVLCAGGMAVTDKRADRPHATSDKRSVDRALSERDSEFWAIPAKGQIHIGVRLITIASGDITEIGEKLGTRFSSGAGPVRLDRTNAVRIMHAMLERPSARLVFSEATNSLPDHQWTIDRKTHDSRFRLSCISVATPASVSMNTLALGWSPHASAAEDELPLDDEISFLSTLHSEWNRQTVLILPQFQLNAGGDAGSNSFLFVVLADSTGPAGPDGTLRPTEKTVTARFIDLGPEAIKLAGKQTGTLDSGRYIYLDQQQYKTLTSGLNSCRDARLLSTISTIGENGQESMAKGRGILLHSTVATGGAPESRLSVTASVRADSLTHDGGAVSVDADFAADIPQPGGTLLIPAVVRNGKLASGHIVLTAVTADCL